MMGDRQLLILDLPVGFGARLRTGRRRLEVYFEYILGAAPLKV